MLWGSFGSIFKWGRTGPSRNQGRAFPYPVFGRFTYILSALDGHCRGDGFVIIF